MRQGSGTGILNPAPRTLPPPEPIRSHVRQERKVVVCESMVTPRALREAVAHILFRFLQVSGKEATLREQR